MGNCLCLSQGAKTWAVDDEWDRIASTSHESMRHHHKEVSKSPPVAGGGSTIVKIKMTKKELEEMLGKTRLNADRNLPIELLLKQVMNKLGDQESLRDRNRHWRPALKTIPEAAE